MESKYFDFTIWKNDIEAIDRQYSLLGAKQAVEYEEQDSQHEKSDAFHFSVSFKNDQVEELFYGIAKILACHDIRVAVGYDMLELAELEHNLFKED